jgi:hypothetical protein
VSNPKYVPPTRDSNGFHCPHCGVYSHQDWYGGYGGAGTGGFISLKNLVASKCEHCKNYALWIGQGMIYPQSSTAPLPSEDLPPDVKEDYIEARNIVNNSPRGASALLRLSLQKLMPHLGEKGENLDTDIGNLVKKGLSETIQQALDCVRVIGNNAVHPGELALKDDIDTANALFGLVNMITDAMITKPKATKALYDKIPKGAKEAIAKRDK